MHRPPRWRDDVPSEPAMQRVTDGDCRVCAGSSPELVIGRFMAVRGLDVDRLDRVTCLAEDTIGVIQPRNG